MTQIRSPDISLLGVCVLDHLLEPDPGLYSRWNLQRYRANSIDRQDLETLLADSDPLLTDIGGSEVNTAIGLAELGRRVELFGYVGDDSAGARCRSEADLHGSIAWRLGTWDRPTPEVVTLDDEDLATGRRTVIHPNPNAEAPGTRDSVTWDGTASPPGPEGLLGYVTFYTVIRCGFSTVVNFMEAVIRGGGRAVVGLPGLRVLQQPHGSRELISRSCGLLGNRAEYSKLEQSTGVTIRDASSGRWAVRTDGVKPTELFVDGRRASEVRPETDFEIENTCGAGDAFAAGLLHALLDEASIEESVRSGNDHAAVVAQRADFH